MHTIKPSRHGLRIAVASVGVAAAAFTFAPLASAATPTSPPPTTTAKAKAKHRRDPKARCLADETKLEKTVKRYAAHVHKATGVPEVDRATLIGQLDHVGATLRLDRAAIEKAKTKAEAAKECKEMVTSTRVYELYGAKTRAVLAENRVAKAEKRAVGSDARMDKIIARAEKRGVSAEAIADAKAKFADAKAHLADAQHQVDGVVAELLPITPAQVNDGSAKATLAHARTQEKAAAADAKAIRADLKAIRTDLAKKH
ncbi:MAG: hypothetical protein JST73_02270 [Actinobacteria bacterium]|nr:hypothetical protein [Actinomycetota bacterium]